MAEQATYQRLEAPSIMLIALDPTVEALCLSTLMDSGLRILRVREAAPAFERIAVTMPKLVIVQSSIHPKSKDELTDRCVAVGAQLLVIDASEDPEHLKKRLAVAAMGVLGAIYG